MNADNEGSRIKLPTTSAIPQAKPRSPWKRPLVGTHTARHQIKDEVHYGFVRSYTSEKRIKGFAP